MSGNFKIENAITVEELKEKIEAGDHSPIITIEEIFKQNGRIDLQEQDYAKYENGVKIEIKIKTAENIEDGVYRIYLKNKFIGLGTVEEGKLKRDLLLKE